MSKEREDYKETKASLAYMAEASMDNNPNTVVSPLKVIIVFSTALMLTATVKNASNPEINPLIQEMTDINYPYIDLGLSSFEKSEKRTKDVIQTSDSSMSLNIASAISSSESAKERKEAEILQNRLSNCLPVHTLAYILLSTVCIVVSLTLLFMRYALNVYIVDSYYLICTLIISITLFLTALVSLKSWKEFLEN